MELNTTYVIRVMINNRLLTYEAKVISEDSIFITFIDKYGKEISVNKNNIQSFEEAGK